MEHVGEAGNHLHLLEHLGGLVAWPGRAPTCRLEEVARMRRRRPLGGTFFRSTSSACRVRFEYLGVQGEVSSDEVQEE